MGVLVCYLVSAAAAVLVIGLIDRRLIKSYTWFYLLCLVAPIEALSILLSKDGRRSGVSTYLEKRAVNPD